MSNKSLVNINSINKYICILLLNITIPRCYASIQSSPSESLPSAVVSALEKSLDVPLHSGGRITMEQELPNVTRDAQMLLKEYMNQYMNHGFLLNHSFYIDDNYRSNILGDNIIITNLTIPADVISFNNANSTNCTESHLTESDAICKWSYIQVGVNTLKNYSDMNQSMSTSPYTTQLSTTTSTTGASTWSNVIGGGAQYSYENSFIEKRKHTLTFSVKYERSWGGSVSTTTTTTTTNTYSIPSQSVLVPAHTTLRSYAMLVKLDINGIVPLKHSINGNIYANTIVEPKADGKYYFGHGSLNINNLVATTNSSRNLPYGIEFINSKLTFKDLLNLKINNTAYAFLNVICYGDTKDSSSICKTCPADSDSCNFNSLLNDKPIVNSEQRLNLIRSKYSSISSSTKPKEKVKATLSDGEAGNFAFYNSSRTGRIWQDITTPVGRYMLITPADEKLRNEGIYGIGLYESNNCFVYIERFTAYDYKTDQPIFVNNNQYNPSYTPKEFLPFSFSDTCKNLYYKTAGGELYTFSSNKTFPTQYYFSPFSSKNHLGLFIDSYGTVSSADDNGHVRNAELTHDMKGSSFRLDIPYPLGNYGNCTNKSINFDKLYARCNNNIAQLNFRKYCKWKDHFSEANNNYRADVVPDKTGSLLQCAEWDLSRLPAGNYLQSCNAIEFSSSDNVNGYLSAICMNQKGDWIRNVDVFTNLYADCRNENGELKCNAINAGFSGK